MKPKLLLLLSLLLLLLLLSKKPRAVEPERVASRPPPVTPQVPVRPEVQPEPAFITCAPVRAADPGLGLVLGDIDSHLPAGHPYRAHDKITWAHETTHGINAEVRNRYMGERVNAFYCLHNRAVVIPEPKVTLGRVAALVPAGWRGDCYQLYLHQQRQFWDDRPLYLFDEWSAYANGSACYLELQPDSLPSELEFMMEFVGYALVLAQAIHQQDPGYDDHAFKTFVAWQAERSLGLYKRNPNVGKSLERIISAGDGEGVRAFARGYWGGGWCRRVLGF